MANEAPGFTYTKPAAGDLSALQFRGMVIDSNGRASQQTSAGGRIDGVLQNKPAAIDRSATLVKSGETKFVAGAAITRGADLAVDTSGRVVTAATGNRRVGVAMQAAGAAGDVIEVLLGNDGVAP